MGQHRPHRWSPFFIEIQRQGKILSPMRLCSGKIWKSNVKNIFSYNFPRWPVGVKSYRVVLKLLRNHLRQRPQTRNTSNGNPIHVWLSILYNYGSYGKKKKKSVVTKLRHLPENDHSYLDTMTGTNSSNDRLILRRNVEINSNWCIFGNEIVDHVEWKRHCAITKKNVWVQIYFKYQWYTIFNGLSNDHRCNSSFIHHL